MKVILEQFGDFTKSVEVRDYFAVQVLANFMTHKNKLSTTLKYDDYLKRISAISYEYADAMMEARNESK